VTKLLDKAFAKLRELPDEDQDAVALALLGFAEEEMPVADFDDGGVRAADADRHDAAQRAVSLVDAEIAAAWKRRRH
jgi:hypothetical protein